MYLRMIPKDEVVEVIDQLFTLYMEERLESNEEPGYFFRRVGMNRIISYLIKSKKVSHLMEKVDPTSSVLSSETEVVGRNSDAGVVEFIDRFRRSENMASNS